MRPLIVLALVAGCGLTPAVGRVEWTDRHGIEVAPNGYQVQPAEFADVVDATLAAWDLALATLGPVLGATCNTAAAVRGTVVAFRSYPFLHVLEGVELAGLFWASESPLCEVGFVSPLRSTALGHELGHLILWRCGLDPAEEQLAAWHAAFPEIPY